LPANRVRVPGSTVSRLVRARKPAGPGRVRVITGCGLALAVSGLALAGSVTARAAPAGRPAAAAARATPDYVRECPVTTRPGQMACMALIRTDVPHRLQSAQAPGARPAADGYGPPELQAAYGLTAASAQDGAGRVVVVTGAYDDPDAAQDLATYRAAWGLPSCGHGCFEKLNQEGEASPLPPREPDGETGWAGEESLDLDMVSAICPLCHIILVEAGRATGTSLGTAVSTAISLNAQVVSNSWGGPENPEERGKDPLYNHPGIAIVFSAGDDGYGVSYPASSPYVTSVGGTTLRPATNPRGWAETVWGSAAGGIGTGTGSGCSAYEARPSWQVGGGCPARADNDVAADANPDTGVAVYDSYGAGGWNELGGTSASAPIIAGVFALAGKPVIGTLPVSYLYRHTSDFFDVTAGVNGSCATTYLCTAETGYDGPTGWGTPDGVAGFSSQRDIVSVTNPGGQSGVAGTPVRLQIKALDLLSGRRLTYTAAGLPAGLSIDPASGLISGTPAVAATYGPTVTVTDNLGQTGKVSFTWVIAGP
jgi:hypothetical protein